MTTPRAKRWLESTFANYCHKNKLEEKNLFSYYSYFANSFLTTPSLKNISVPQADIILKERTEQILISSKDEISRDGEEQIYENISYKILSSESDLEEEGKRMRNCIGGYSMEKYIRHVSVRKDGKSFINLSLVKKDDYWKLKECKRIYNNSILKEDEVYLKLLFSKLGVKITTVRELSHLLPFETEDIVKNIANKISFAVVIVMLALSIMLSFASFSPADFFMDHDFLVFFYLSTFFQALRLLYKLGKEMLGDERGALTLTGGLMLAVLLLFLFFESSETFFVKGKEYKFVGKFSSELMVKTEKGWVVEKDSLEAKINYLFLLKAKGYSTVVCNSYEYSSDKFCVADGYLLEDFSLDYKNGKYTVMKHPNIVLDLALVDGLSFIH